MKRVREELKNTSRSSRKKRRCERMILDRIIDGKEYMLIV